jgi:hypothetical protein
LKHWRNEGDIVDGFGVRFLLLFFGLCFGDSCFDVTAVFFFDLIPLFVGLAASSASVLRWSTA